MHVNSSHELSPMPPSPGPIDIGILHPVPVGQIGLGTTKFDGDDYNPFNPSFDIDGGAARIVAAYDRDGSGGLDVNTETTRYEGSHQSSIRNLATFADAIGNHDGTATAKEIAAAMRRFDLNTSGASRGRLSGQERSAFLEVFGEAQQPIYFHHMRPGLASPIDWGQPGQFNLAGITFGPLHPYQSPSGPADAKLAIKRDLGNEVRSQG